MENVTKSHILHCSYHNLHAQYRNIMPKSRIIPLPTAFLDYLRSDGIVLPDDDDNESPDDEDEDISAPWRPLHNQIKQVIAELGGNVVPKLNWSAPKDATWINANTMSCRLPSEIYLLLKSSDFITHDLEHAFDDCVDSPDTVLTPADIPYHLVLKKYVAINPSLEFRCFVRARKILGMSQRDLNHYDYLAKMSGMLRSRIQEFFDLRLRDSFPDEDFVFDVYIPAPYRKVWLVDVNPWAPKTDPLLFTWQELLEMPEPVDEEAEAELGGVVRLSLGTPAHLDLNGDGRDHGDVDAGEDDGEDEDDNSDDSDVEDIESGPELRLVGYADRSLNAAQYSAHKLPKDVVDASQGGGGGLREFADGWKDMLAKRQRDDADESSSEED